MAVMNPAECCSSSLAHLSDFTVASKWILDEGNVNPDIFYTDKAGVRNYECLTMGINDGAWHTCPRRGHDMGTKALRTHHPYPSAASHGAAHSGRPGHAAVCMKMKMFRLTSHHVVPACVCACVCACMCICRRGVAWAA